MKMYTLLLCCASCWAGEKHVSIQNNITVTDNSQAQQQTMPLKAALSKKNVRESQPDVVRQEADDKDEITCCCFIKLRKRLS